MEQKVLHLLGVSEYGGMDWHDSCTTYEQLRQDGSFDIKDMDVARAQFIYKDMQNMQQTAYPKDGPETEIKLEDIPSYEEILDAVRNKRDIRAESEKQGENGEWGGEMTYHYNTERDAIYKEYSYGQVTFSTYFIEQDIPAERVGYLACENVLAPTKGVSSVLRFYHEPYVTEEEAQKALDEMQLHSEDSVKELRIIDVEAEKEKPWYQNNIKAFGQEEWSLYGTKEAAKEISDLFKKMSDTIAEAMDGIFEDAEGAVNENEAAARTSDDEAEL